MVGLSYSNDAVVTRGDRTQVFLPASPQETVARVFRDPRLRKSLSCVQTRDLLERPLARQFLNCAAEVGIAAIALKFIYAGRRREQRC